MTTYYLCPEGCYTVLSPIRTFNQMVGVNYELEVVALPALKCDICGRVEYPPAWNREYARQRCKLLKLVR